MPREPAVAVILTGHVRARSPDGGANIHANLLGPLGPAARVLLVLTSRPRDGAICACSGSSLAASRDEFGSSDGSSRQATPCDCPLSGYTALAPLAAHVSVDRAPSREWLGKTLHALQHWPRILSALNHSGSCVARVSPRGLLFHTCSKIVTSQRLQPCRLVVLHVHAPARCCVCML